MINFLVIAFSIALAIYLLKKNNIIGNKDDKKQLFIFIQFIIFVIYDA